MRRVYKYPINSKPWCGPPIKKILGAAFQHDVLYAWCEVEDDSTTPYVNNRWLLYPTGTPVHGTHAFSVGHLENAYIWHIYHYEAPEVPEERTVDTDGILDDLRASEVMIFQRRRRNLKGYSKK